MESKQVGWEERLDAAFRDILKYYGDQLGPTIRTAFVHWFMERRDIVMESNLSSDVSLRDAYYDEMDATNLPGPVNRLLRDYDWTDGDFIDVLDELKDYPHDTQ